MIVACALAFMPLISGQVFAAKKAAGPKITKKTYTVSSQKVTVKWKKNKKAKSYQVKVGSKKAKTVKKSKASYAVKYAQTAKKQTIKIQVRAKVGKKWTKYTTAKLTIPAKAVDPTPTPTTDVTAVGIDNMSPKVGDTLTAVLYDKDGNVVTDDTATYQWYRVNTTTGVVAPIAQATNATYQVAYADFGTGNGANTLYCEVTAGGKTIATAQTNVVKQTTITDITIVGMSEKTGTSKTNNVPVVGDTLTATLTPATAATGVSYQWYRGTAKIVGATNATYTVIADDLGYKLKCVVTVEDGYAFEAAGITSKEVVIKNTVKTSISSAEITLKPTDPEVGGTAVKATVKYNGKEITIDEDGWVLTWYRDAVKNANKVKNQTGASYQAVTDDLGYKLIAVLTNTDTAKYVGSAQAETSPVTIGLKQAAIESDTQKTTGEGTEATTEYNLAAGTTLTVKKITDQNDQTVKVNTTNATYQWYRGSKAIEGATGISYTLTADDVSNEAVSYKCVVTGAGNYGGACDSNVITEKVVAKQDIKAAEIVDANGNTAKYAAVGDVLTITTEPAAAVDAVSVTWMVANKNNINTDPAAAGTEKTYTVKTGDTSIAAVVNYTAKDGEPWNSLASALAATTGNTEGTDKDKVMVADKLGAVTATYNNRASKTETATYTSAEAEVGLYVHATVAGAPAQTEVVFYSDSACTKKLDEFANDKQITKDIYNNKALKDHTVYARAEKETGYYAPGDAIAIQLVPSKSTITAVVFRQANETVTTIDATKALGAKITVTDPAGNEEELTSREAVRAGYEVVFESETETHKTGLVEAKTFNAGDSITVTVTPDGVTCTGEPATKTATALVAE